MDSNHITLTPYLHFEGNCEEALNHYQEILGGEINIQDRYDNPNMDVPDDYADKVLHARFHFGGNTIMASDVFPGQSVKQSSGDVALTLNIDNTDQARQVFDALAKDGEVHFPFEKQFWGDWLGNLTDRYGIRWMVSVED